MRGSGETHASEVSPRGNWVFAYNENLSDQEAEDLVNHAGPDWRVLGRDEKAIYVGRPLPANVSEIAQQMSVFGAGWLMCNKPEHL